VRAGNSLNVLLLTVDTLRPDHLGIYGYARPTSPRIDAFAREAVVFERAYTYWPKTRGSFVMMFTGRLPSQNGYSKKHPLILGFNTTLAEVLKGAGYVTAAVVDNPNVAAQYGYDKGFERYRETWMEPALATETDRSRAISDDGVAFLQAAPRDRPFFLWLHWVNPHAPYTPPPPYDTKFLDAAAASGTRLRPVEGFHGGVRREWAVPGRDRLGYYVAQYDGEIAAVDEQVGRVLDALRASGQAERTLVLLTSDHGESLGEHDYYFDHGENLFDPNLRIPLLIAYPGSAGGTRTRALASTLDLVPTVLDAVKLPYPPGLAGQSLLALAHAGTAPERARLFAQNERHLSAAFDARHKLVATPGGTGAGPSLVFYDRARDPGETRAASGAPDLLRLVRRDLELFLERGERDWVATRVRAGDAPGEAPMTAQACEQLKALGYVQHCP
jgi:arylsulfatase A-like enzyme